MKNALLLSLGLACVATPALAASNSANGKVFSTFEKANAACLREAKSKHRSYMVSASYNLRFKFQGWVCRIGDRDN